MQDGVHIGIVPESKDQKSDQKHDLLCRRCDAEACTVLVGCLSSAANLCKQLGPRSGPTDRQNVGPDLDSNWLTLMVSLKEFFE